MKYDLLIKRGHVVDPSQKIDGVRDVAFSGNKVATIMESIPESGAREVIDAEGLIVAPGLIDLHVHNYWGVTHFGIDPDSTNVSKGVTTALDAGSAGARTFPAFRRYVMERSTTRLFALMNISAMGMISPKVQELQDLRWADVDEAVEVARANRELVLGIKARLSEPIARDRDLDVLKRALEAAEAIGGFLMIHVGDTNSPMEDLVAMLRTGDVVTHSFHGNRHGVLDDGGKVIDGMREAQRRGVVFDIGHGAGSFSFKVAEAALSQGFYPGNISSDLHFYNVNGPVFDHTSVLSKFIHLGLSLYDTVRMTTETTARVMGLGDRLGTLRPGAEADVSILRMEEGGFDLTDSMGVTVRAGRRLSSVTTIRNGNVYSPHLGPRP